MNFFTRSKHCHRERSVAVWLTFKTIIAELEVHQLMEPSPSGYRKNIMKLIRALGESEFSRIKILSETAAGC